MERGLQTAFGVTDIRDRVSYSGRTDVAITTELLTLHGLDPSPQNLATLQAEYLAHLPTALQKLPGTVLPGIVEGLRRLQANRVAVGLLTGNIAAGAEIKLRHFGLWEHFPFGGFADGLRERDDVARRAFEVAMAHVRQSLDPANVWVIGDTPLDVQCARAIGAKVVAVGTGWHPMHELAAAKPDRLYRDFTEASELFDEWGLA
jgi:phosphoglycolate phosphatase-like HAD superfamily hydrolase